VKNVKLQTKITDQCQEVWWFC